MPVASETVPELRVGGGGRGRGFGDRRGGGDGGRGGRGGRGGDDFERRASLYRTGVWVALAPIVMFFAAFCSAYIVRRGLSNDWRPLDLPNILWLNTGLLIASSIALEQARGYLKRGREAPFSRWWAAATALGVAFLAGQLVAWRELTAGGVYMTSNPSGSFFYLLTAAHALHLLGGEAGLLYVALRTARRAVGEGPRIVVDVTRIYWHFISGVWIFVFAMLLLWR